MKNISQTMMPTKKWLTMDEGMAYTATGRDKFSEVFAPKVSISLIGKTKVYRVADIDKLIEQNILISK